MPRKIVIVATPTSPLLLQLLHALQHEAGLEITVLTRQTSISIPASGSDSHSHSHGHNGTTSEHHHASEATHIQTDFSESELQAYFKGVDTVICTLTGSDLHLSGPLVDAAAAAGVKFFIPSEYGLDTSNSKIRDLLPPYRTRFEIQEKLRASGLEWKAIYSGIGLEDAMKTDGLMGVDALWASVVVFPGSEKLKVAVSSTEDVARSIIEVVRGEDKKVGNEVYTCGFMCTLEEVIAVVEKELEKDVDRYEGNLKGAEKEATERMKRGYFDGGVALMGRVAVWDLNVDAWGSWKGQQGKDADKWEGGLRKVVKQVRSGDIGGDGCGC
ncbi:NmrA-like family-domain-containing protein [Leptodontidium sp. MPI-SDFR-AT-0119]|nr:NmrA-like family-domain-containing protein [Leptodontidium sp. MPI-SDFR-AT-0119]